MNIKNVDKIKNLLLVFGLIISIIVFFCLGINDDSYALLDNDNYMGDYILNPKWVEYMDLTEEEKGKLEIVPDKFIHQYKKRESGFRVFSVRSTLPEYYNLNDYGHSTFPDNQGNLGICWAFGALSSVETYMLKNGMSNTNNPIKFSTRQLDYVSVGHNYVKEGFNPYYIEGSYRNGPGSGAVVGTAFYIMSAGITPVTEDIYGAFNQNTSIKSIGETFNLDDVEYVVDSYVNYGSIGGYVSDNVRKSWVNEIKTHVMNYGSVLVSTIGPLPVYAGNCLYRDGNNNYMLNVKGDCNPVNTENGHAMAIIGWDDNYEYKYCRLEDDTTNDLTGCTDIVSGKGAFILKNSWGTSYPYPYLAYESSVYGAYGITGVSIKNWDNNYDYTKAYDYSFKHEISSITYYKSDALKEKLKKISFMVNTKKEIVYDVFLSHDGKSEFTKIGSVVADKVGLVSISVNDIQLNNDKFVIKIISEGGYVDLIHAFTENIDDSSDIIIDTKIINGPNYVVNDNIIDFYSVTRNVDNGKELNYKVVNTNGNIIADFSHFNLNHMVSLVTFGNKNGLPVGKIKLLTYYDNVLYDTDEIVVTQLESLWSGGSGSYDDPYLITSVDDFIKIFTNEDYMSVHYKLVSDLDFSNISDWNAGELTNFTAFTGSFDGDGHVISGLNGSTNITSLFYSLNEAEVKNLVFSDINFDVTDSGWGNFVAIMAHNSTLSNIRISKSVSISGSAKYAGGVVGSAYNSSFVNIANYADISTDYASNGKAAGIVVEAYGSTIEKCYNYGNITASNSIAAGIVASLGNDSSTDVVGSVVDVYNLGYIKTDLIGAGIVGVGTATLVENSYNIFSKSINVNKVANIVGTSNGMVIRNSYYNTGYGKSIINDDNSTLVNVMEKTNSQLKDKNTYLNFDFENIWTIDNDYPYLKDFYYYYLSNIIVDSDIKINLGETKLLEMNFVPSYASNKSVRYEIDNEKIISIDDSGLISALNVGSTVLRVIPLDGSGIVKEINVVVGIDKINLDDYKVIENKYIQVQEGYNIDSFVNSIYEGDTLDIQVVSPNDYIATGDTIGIYEKNGDMIFEYVAIVLGETTGDGVVDLGDVAKLYQYNRGVFDMNHEFKLAANVVSNDVLDLGDVAKLYQYIRGGIQSLEEKK